MILFFAAALLSGLLTAPSLLTGKQAKPAAALAVKVSTNSVTQTAATDVPSKKSGAVTP